MHRQSILHSLDKYEAVYPSERTMTDRIRTLVTQHTDCFERTCLPGHITGSAWIVSHDLSQYLLTHHRKLDRWLQLGGHADGQHEPYQVAIREAVEESGLTGFTLYKSENSIIPLDIDVHLIPTRGSEPAHEHHDIRYLLIAPANQVVKVSDESHDVRWFTREEFLRVTGEMSLLRMLYKGEQILK